MMIDEWELKNKIEGMRLMLMTRTDREKANVFYRIRGEVQKYLGVSREMKERDEGELVELSKWYSEQIKTRTTTKERSEGLDELLNKIEVDTLVGDFYYVTGWLLNRIKILI